MSKRFFFIIVLLLNISISVAQTAKTHTVQRGETIESIARKYNVTVDALKQANPNVKQTIYVGLKLNIPERQQMEVPKEQQQAIVEDSNASNLDNSVSTLGNTSIDNTSLTQVSKNKDIEDLKKVSIFYRMSYGFLKKPKGVKGYSDTYAIIMGANYNIVKEFYIGAGVGYTSSRFRFDIDSSTRAESDYHFVSVPIEIGGRLFLKGNSFALVPFAGLGMHICVKAKSKLGKEKVDNDNGGKAGFDARIGIRLKVGEDFDIGFAYRFPLNEKQEGFTGEKGYPEIFLQFGF